MDPKLIEKLLAGIEYESTRKGPPDGFPQLPDIPGGRYSDPEFLRLEREYLWKKAWLYAGHMDELPEAGQLFFRVAELAALYSHAVHDRKIHAA